MLYVAARQGTWNFASMKFGGPNQNLRGPGLAGLCSFQALQSLRYTCSGNEQRFETQV